MSYELCKRITLNEKKNKITLTTASNNVYPKDYRTFTYCDSEQECYKNVTFEEKLISLITLFPLTSPLYVISFSALEKENKKNKVKNIANFFIKSFLLFVEIIQFYCTYRQYLY